MEKINIEQVPTKPIGRAYTWGLGDTGALGNNSKNSESTPYLVPIKEKISSISSGGHTTVCITENGEVYSFGTNKHGRIGQGDQDTFLNPKKVLGLKAIALVSCGNWHTMLLDTNGLIYGTGANKHGVLGLGDQLNRNTFTRVADIKDIISISAGDGFTLFINNKGIIMSCGIGSKNGSANKKDRLSPMIIDKLKDQVIHNISAGFVHAACVNDKGELYTWGSSDYLQLGHGVKKEEQEPRKVEGLKQKIIQVSCSRGEKYCHTGCVDENGFVYTWGSGYKGKLGHSESWSHEDSADEALPKRIECIKDIKMMKISCGGIHTAILSQDNRLYTFGCGSDGRLGHEESDKHVYLYKEGYPREVGKFKGKVVYDISCSYYHCVALVSE